MNILKYLFGDRVYVDCLRRGRITLISVPHVCVGTSVVPRMQVSVKSILP